MADGKILSSLNNINKDVKGIHGEIKKFGPKLPSGTSEEDSLLDEAQLNTFTALAGLIGVLSGKKVTKLGDITQIINKSTSKDNLFVVLKNFIDEQINPKDLYREDSIYGKFIKKTMDRWLKQFIQEYDKKLKFIYGEKYDAITNVKSEITTIADKIDELLELYDDSDNSFVSRQIFSDFEDRLFKKIGNISISSDPSSLKLDPATLVDSYISELNAKISDIFKDFSEKVKENSISQGRIEIELISNSKDLADLVDKLTEFSENSKLVEDNFETTIKSINGLISVIDYLGDKFNEIDTVEISKGIENINKIIGNDDKLKDSSLKKLIGNLMTIIPDAGSSENKKQDVSAVISLIEVLAKIQDTKKNADRIKDSIEKYIDITSKGGLFSKLFDNLKTLGEISVGSNVKTSIQAVGQLFDLINKDLYISPFKALKIKFGLMNFRMILSKEFVKFVDSLKDIKELSQNQNESIIIVDNLIEAVSKIGDLGILRQTKMLLNIKFLKTFVINSVKDLLDELNNQLKDVNASDVANTIKNIDDLLGSLVDIGKLDNKEYENFFNRIDFLIFIIEKKIPQIISQISSYEVNSDSVDSLTEYFDNINKMIDHLPGILSLVGAAIKVDLLSSTIVPGFKNLSENINGLQIRSDMKALEFWDVLEYELNEIDKLNVIISDIKSFKETTKTIKSEVIPELESIDNFVDKLNDLLKTSPNKNLVFSLLEDYALLIMELGEESDLGKAINSVAVVKKSDFNNLKNLTKYVEELNNLAKILIAVGKIDQIIKGIDTLLSMVLYINDKLVAAVNKITLDEKQISKLSLGIKELMKVVVMSAGLLIFAGLVMMVVPIVNILLFTTALTIFVGTMVGVFGWASKYANQSMETLEELTKLVVASGLLLIFAGIVTKLGILESALGFAVMLSVFVGAISFIFVKASKSIEQSIQGLDDLAFLVVTSGAILIYGSIIYHFIKWEDLFGFTIAVGAFIFAMTFTVATFADQLKESLEGVKDLAILVVATGLTIALGSFMFKWVDWKSAFLFVGATLLFTVAIVTIFSLLDKKLGILDPFRQALKGVKDLAILVIAAGLTLALGSFVYKYVDIVSAFLFTFVLARFIIAVMSPFILAKKSGMMGIAEKSGREFGILLLFSTFTLMIGGLLFTLYPQIIPGTALFALVLGGFVWGVCSAFAKIDPKKIWPKAIALLLITVISGGMLLYAGKMMADNPDLKSSILIFAITLFGYLMGMTVVLKRLNKIKKDLFKGILALGLLCTITLLATKAISMAAEMVHLYSWAEIGGGILALIAGIGLIGLAYWGMGYATFFDGGIGLGLATLSLTAISGLSFLTVNALMYISKHQKDFSVKDINKFRDGIKALGDLAWEMTIRFVPFGIVLPLVSASVASLGFALSVIAKSIADYSSLVVPEYEGKKIVRYRKLTSKDFTQAARNVKQIITVLGGAVIDTYNKRPEIFETGLFGRSKFSIVAKSLKTLGPMLSSIAKSVKEYASLKIPVYQGTKVVKYEKLDKPDFVNAANNVKEIIVTLGGAVIDTYDKKPEIFETNFWGTSKFAKVTKSLKTLAPLISSIAKSVKDYADFKIVDKWGQDKDGNLVAKEYRHLNDNDFANAAMNVQTIISTLGNAIISCYDNNPDMYESSLFKKSKFAKVVDANITLAKLISRIGKAVANMANLQVGMDYKMIDGVLKPTRMEQLNNSDFKKASENILTIITTLGKPIEKIAGDQTMSEIYESTSGFLGMGTNKSKFAMVIDGNLKLAKLISDVGKAVAQMANLQVGIDYKMIDGELKPTRMEQLGNSHFQKAAQNVLTILTTLGQPIQEIAADKTQMELFESSNGVFGIGAKKSKFITVIEGNLKLATLISKIGSAVKDMAKLKIVTGYDKDGKPIGYRVMGKEDFTNVAENIKKIITVLGKSIIDAYNDNEDLFEDGEDSVFAQANTAIGTMGNMISSIAGGLSAYAQLRIPDWSAGTNSDGTPKKYLKLGKETFRDASKAISSIITNMGNTVIEQYKAHEEWFDAGEDSDFTKACVSISSMGTMIGSISEGIKSYAELRIPIEYDNHGNPKKFRELGKNDFENASKNIALVVSTIGQTIIDLYNGKVNGQQLPNAELIKQMFDYDPEKSTDSIFSKVIQSCTNIGDMISSIAEGVQMFAEAKMPTGFDPKTGKPLGFTKLNDDTYKLAARTIESIITTIGGAINSTFYKYQEWFKVKPLKKSSGFLGLGSDEEPNPSDPPIVQAIKGISFMGNAIGSIALGVQTFASAKMPVKFDSNGKPIEYAQMNDTVYKSAAKSIGDVITILGQSIYDVYSKKTWLFNNPNLNKIMTSFQQMGLVIGSMAKGVQEYAKLSIPDGIDPKTGKGINYRKVKDSDFVTAGNQVAKVLTCIGESIKGVAEGELFTKSSGAINTVINMYSKIVPVIGGLSMVVKQFASMTIPKEFDSKGRPKSFIKFGNEDVQKAAETIGSVLTAIGKGIVDGINNHPELFGQNPIASIFAKKSIDELPVMVAVKAISAMAAPIVKIAGVLKSYSGEQFFDPSDKDRKNPITLTQSQIELAKLNMKSIVSTLGDVMWYELNESPHKDIYKDKGTIDSFKKILDSIINTISGVISGFTPIFGQLEHQVKLNGKQTTVLNAFTNLINGEPQIQQDLAKVIAVVGELGQIISKHKVANISGQKNQYGTALAVISNILTNAYNMVNTIDKAKIGEKDILTVFSENSDKYIAGIERISDVFRDLSLYIGLNGAKNIKYTEEDYGYPAIKTLVMNAMELDGLLQNINIQIFHERLTSIITAFNEAVYKLSTIGNISSNDSNGGILSSLSDSLFGGGNEITKNIDLFSDSIERIIQLSVKAIEAKDDGYRYIGDGIDYVNESISKIQEQEYFDQHQQVMDKYINTVNKIDVMKANKLINIVNAMNVLASRMGNLDNLTAAISDGLTKVLDKLVRELSTAKETIEKAEKLQKNRYNLINSQIKEVKKIMSQTLSIEITKVEDDQSLQDGSESPSILSSGSKSSNTSSGGSGTGTSVRGNGGSGEQPKNINPNGGPVQRTKSKQDIETANKQRKQTRNEGLTPDQLDAILRKHIPNRFRLDPKTNVIIPIA